MLKNKLDRYAIISINMPGREFYLDINQTLRGEISGWHNVAIDRDFQNFSATIETPFRKKLRGVLIPNEIGIGLLNIPLVTVSKSKGGGYGNEILRVFDNLSKLNQNEIEFDLDNPNFTKIYQKLKLEFKEVYKGKLAKIATQSFNFEDSEAKAVGMSIAISLIELDKPKLSNPSTHIAVGLSKDFSDALPRWKMSPGA